MATHSCRRLGQSCGMISIFAMTSSCPRHPIASTCVSWRRGVRSREWRGLCSEAVPVLHQFPVGVLVEYLVAAKLVEVAAAVVQLLAVDAGTGHHPHRDSAVAGDERVDVVPTHVGDDVEPIAEHLPDRRLAV